MKKMCSFVLVFALLFSMTTPAFATDAQNVDSASYVDSVKGDLMTIAVISTHSINTASNNNSAVNAFRILRNGQIEEVFYVDFSNDLLRHEYADGSVKEQLLSSVVTITEVETSQIDQPSLTSVSDETLSFNQVDYVDNEPFEITKNGTQAPLAGVPIYSSYSAMGSRGGFPSAPNMYGYLQRYNAGVANTYLSHLFSFAAETTIGTAAGIIYTFLSSQSIAGFVLGTIVSLLGAIIEAITYDWSVLFDVKTFKWLYRIRLNSNTGPIIYTFYRTKDFALVYNQADGKLAYQYRGASFDGGPLTPNYELIGWAIDAYIENHS